MVISAHYGNFELGGYLMGLFGFPTYTVARKLDNLYLDQFINRFRGRTGQYILPSAERRRDQGSARRGRHLDAAGRPVGGEEGLLGDVLRPSGLHAQGSVAVLPATKHRPRSATPGGSGGRWSMKSGHRQSASRAESLAPKHGTQP